MQHRIYKNESLWRRVFKLSKMKIKLGINIVPSPPDNLGVEISTKNCDKLFGRKFYKIKF